MFSVRSFRFKGFTFTWWGGWCSKDVVLGGRALAFESKVSRFLCGLNHISIVHSVGVEVSHTSHSSMDCRSL